MAYTHNQFEVMVAKDASIASAAVVGEWAPGYQPVIIRAIAYIPTTTADQPGALELNKRITPGSQTGEVQQTTLTYTVAQATAGNVLYQDGLEIEVNPGEELAFEITDATPTAGAGHLVIWGEIVSENPANNTDMTELSS